MKNGEGHEEGRSYFVFFPPFFVVFVAFVLGVWLRLRRVSPLPVKSLPKWS